MLINLIGRFVLLILGLLTACSSLFGQADFRAGFLKDDPAPIVSGLPTEERLVIHQTWLKDAEAKKDTLQRIYGEMFVFYDYVRLNDLATAAAHILEAEHLAKASGNIGWRGGVAFRIGHLHTYLREPEKTLIAVKQAHEWCAAAGDSLCVAESLESLSATYGFMDSFDLAHHYFEQALPMLRKFGEQRHLNAALGNYGSLLTNEGNPEAAIPYLEEAQEIAVSLNVQDLIGISIHNLASAYRHSGNTSRAIDGYKEALAHNKKHGFIEKMVRNYAGLRQSYQEIGDYQSAIAYQEKFYNLQDSLIGSKTKIRIAELETQFLESEQSLALEKSDRALRESKQRVERRELAIFMLLLLTLIVAGIWRLHTRRQRAKIVESKKDLAVVTRLLKEKNEALMTLKEFTTSQNHEKLDKDKTPENKESQEQENHLNLFDQSILTSTDWTDFKAYFNKSFPGYVKRLRDAYPKITEAEERLFFLIKLQMKSKEISHLLGISVNSVKKTRNRLRKKLPLTAEDGLEDFIHRF